MTTERKILIVVPARMGSTRVKLKNIREIYQGLNLVDLAINCSLNYTTCISTDKPSMFDYLISKNIEIIARPADISDANSNVSYAVTHALIAMESKFNCKFDTIVTLMPAIASRSQAILEDMIKTYLSSKFLLSSSMSVAETHPWLWKVTKDNIHNQKYTYASNSWHPFPQKNSQDLPNYFVEHASVIINSRDNVLKGLKWNLPLQLYTLPAWSVIFDIDTEYDLSVAKAFYPASIPLLDAWRGKTYNIDELRGIEVDQ